MLTHTEVNYISGYTQLTHHHRDCVCLTRCPKHLFTPAKTPLWVQHTCETHRQTQTHRWHVVVHSLQRPGPGLPRLTPLVMLTQLDCIVSRTYCRGFRRQQQTQVEMVLTHDSILNRSTLFVTTSVYYIYSII